jgi:HPt (histidine-containing phosphotransfer) domain-containing protein
MTDPAILDLVRLREIYEDDRDGIADVLELALETTRRQLTIISSAVDDRNAAAVQAAAHAIKGAALNVGAEETAKHAAELERDASAARWDVIPRSLAVLREGFARFEEAVLRFKREG